MTVAAVTAVDDPVERSRICEEVLHELPGWFGLDEANARYVREVSDLPVFAVGRDAFLALKIHSARAAEVYVMAFGPASTGVVSGRRYSSLRRSICGDRASSTCR